MPRHRGCTFVLVVGVVAACGSSSSPASNGAGDGGLVGDDSGNGGTDGGGAHSESGAPSDSGPGSDAAHPVDAGPPPTATCTPPITLADVSHPTATVGQGSASQCTEAALSTAIQGGGVITFDCGGATSIAITAELAVPTDRDTVLDGGGMITLDGGHATRLLNFNSGDYRGMYGGAQHTLTVQNITLTNAKASGTMMFPSASPPCSQGYQDGAGGAILMTSGMLHVIDVTFTNNEAADIGPDVAGGAIYTSGSLDTTIVGSRFAGNSASNGGAVGSINSDLTLVNDTFTQNQAQGQGGNATNATCPIVGGQRETGSGGNGGAVSIDGGADGTDTICGTEFSSNSAHALAGAIFRTPDGAQQTTNIDRSTFDGNTCAGTYNGAATGGAGAMYFHNSHVVLTNSTISNNSAPGSGGFFSDSTTLDATNCTFAGNIATAGVGGAIASMGSLTNCTLSNNLAQGTNYAAFAAALFGGPWTIANTIFDGNVDNDNSGNETCANATNSGGHDLQWPMGSTDSACAPGITFSDAMLGPLANHGGTTDTVVPAAATSLIQTGTNCPATDQTGQPRATPCTLGAIEVH
jgi:predicted outer membrane repeat protein